MITSHRSKPDAMDGFSLSGPLPRLSRDKCPGHFSESVRAEVEYLGARSPDASPNIVTYHAVERTGAVAGYIVFKVAQEDSAGSSRIFVACEYVYVMQKFRRRGLSKMLLGVLLREVLAVLHAATGSGRHPKVYLFSASHAGSPGEIRVLRSLEREFLELSKRCVGVDFIGRLLEQPHGARQRLWALAQPRRSAA